MCEIEDFLFLVISMHNQISMSSLQSSDIDTGLTGSRGKNTIVGKQSFSIRGNPNVLELHGRLFDHRPVLQGHITSFVKEFEERRGNQETDRLDALHQNISGMKTHVAESSNALDTFLTNIQAKLRVAVEVCRKIQEKEDNVEASFLEEERGKRRAEWDEFMQQQFDKSAQVDQDLDKEIQKILSEYKELESKLDHISTQST